MTRSGWRRSLHQTSTISQPSWRNVPRRRASRCWAVGVACHCQLWHSTPTRRSGSARSSSASRMPRRSRTGYSSTSRTPARASTPAASRWNQLRGRRWSTRSPSSISSAGGPARPRRRHAVATVRSSSVVTPRAQRAVERPGGAADADARGQQGERGGDRQRRDARRRRTTWSGDVAAGAVDGDAEAAVRVGAAGAEDVDGVVVVEAVEAVQPRRRAVGDGRRRRSTARPPSPGGGTSTGDAADDEHARGTASRSRPSRSEAVLDAPGDAERPGPAPSRRRRAGWT